MDQAAQTMIDNLKKNTGKSLDQWIAIVKTSGLKKHGEIVKHLKEKHGFTHGFANLVAMKTLKTDAGSAEDMQLIEDQYKGKEDLKPVFNKLMNVIRSFGDDVEIAPKRAYVSLRAKKQFGLIQPSTKTRLDVGINLKGTAAAGRLEASGSFNSMCSHRVRLNADSEIDAELISWLKEAYEAAR